MATKRHGRADIIRGASRTSPKHQTPTGPQAALAALGGVAYVWDLIEDSLTWGPNAAAILGLANDALPRTGGAFSQLIEPGTGLGRHNAVLAGGGGSGTFDTRYALRFGPNRVVMAQDAGRWQADAQGRLCLVRGLLRPDSDPGAQDLLPAAVKARSALLCRIQDDINEALQFSHTCTLVVGAFDAADGAAAMEGIARDLRPMMRRGDHVATLAPNTFALTLASCPASEAGNAMKRLRDLVKNQPARDSLRLGASCAPDHTFEALKLLRFAEQALAKAAGRPDAAVLHRNRQALPPKAQGRTPIDVIEVLNDRRLSLSLQPVVDAQSRRPALTQARAGIRGSDGRLLPAVGLPGIEGAELSVLVDARMLELAADHLSDHPEERLALPIALGTFLDSQWLPMLAAHLGARPGIESRLVIEVPEAALADAGRARGRLDAMKALGIGIGLSGYGTGYASLAHLQILPIDILKIDGVFIQALKRSTADRLFVRTLIEIAHHLGIATAAEWVDDEADASSLSAWGVDYLQGGLFGAAEAAARPQPELRRMRQA